MVQILGENNVGTPPTVTQLGTWVDTYGLTFPALSDPGWNVASRFEADGYIPSWTLIGRGLEVLNVDDSRNLSERNRITKIEDALAE